MKYYVWVNNEIKHICRTKAEAEERTAKMRSKYEIVATPEFRKGSIIHKDGKEWAIVVHNGEEAMLLQKLQTQSEFLDPISKENIPYYVRIGYLDAKEDHVRNRGEKNKNTESN